MKKFYFLFVSLIIGMSSFAQTATNFVCNDCNGGSHDLYSELDAGKVVVICWVMPCSSCIPNSKTSYNVVNTFQTTNPGRVFFYMVDDYGDTPCSSLNSWANSNNMPQSSYSQRFVNTSIKMTDYGATGMPKIVVLGGSSHSVFFNSTVNTFNSVNLQAAINSALSAASGVEEANSDFNNISLFPIPTSNQTTLSINLKYANEVAVEIYNVVGNKMLDKVNYSLNSGDNRIQLKTSDFSNGLYFVKVSVADRTKILKLIISN